MASEIEKEMIVVVLNQRQLHAADKLFQLVCQSLANESAGIHAETAISTVARLAGSALFRTFWFGEALVFSKEPGSAVFSEEANTEGPKLVDLLVQLLDASGIQVDQQKMKIAKYDKPHLTFIMSMNLIQENAYKIKDEFNLSLEELAQSSVLTTYKLMVETRNVVGVESSFKLAIYSFVEGTKAVPPGLTTSKS